MVDPIKKYQVFNLLRYTELEMVEDNPCISSKDTLIDMAKYKHIN